MLNRDRPLALLGSSLSPTNPGGLCIITQTVLSTGTALEPPSHYSPLCFALSCPGSQALLVLARAHSLIYKRATARCHASLLSGKLSAKLQWRQVPTAPWEARTPQGTCRQVVKEKTGKSHLLPAQARMAELWQTPWLSQALSQEEMLVSSRSLSPRNGCTVGGQGEGALVSTGGNKVWMFWATLNLWARYPV